MVTLQALFFPGPIFSNFDTNIASVIIYLLLYLSLFDFSCNLPYMFHYICNSCLTKRGRRDSMVVGFTTTYAISAYYHWCWWVWISIRARCTTLFDKVCQWLSTGRWFSLVSSTNKTDHHDIAEILLKVALNIIKPTNLTKNLLKQVTHSYTTLSCIT